MQLRFSPRLTELSECLRKKTLPGHFSQQQKRCGLIHFNTLSRALRGWDLSVPSSGTSALLRNMSHILAGVWLESFGMALINYSVVLCHINGHIFFMFPVLINFLINFFFFTVLSYTPKTSFNPGANPNEVCCAC